MTTHRQLRADLAALRDELLSAEIDRRWALRSLATTGLDPKPLLAAYERCRALENALFFKEAELAWQEKRDELLPPRETYRDDREEPSPC